MEPILIREVVCQDTRGVQHSVRVMQHLRFIGEDAAKSGKWIQSLQYIVDGRYTVDQSKSDSNLIIVDGTDIEIRLS